MIGTLYHESNTLKGLMQSLTQDRTDFAAARLAMINSQLRTSGVNAAWALARMRDVPRETFVPPAQSAMAYSDRAIHLNDGYSMAAPVFYGMMLQEARPVPHDRALVVSTAPAYLAELFRPLVSEVTALTPAEAFERSAVEGDVTLLLIDGAAEQVPGTVTARLAPGGRAVGGIIRDGVQRLATGRVVGGELVFQPIMEMGIPRVSEFDKPKEWRF